MLSPVLSCSIPRHCSWASRVSTAPRCALKGSSGAPRWCYLERQVLELHFGNAEDVTEGFPLGPPPLLDRHVLHRPPQLFLPHRALLPVILEMDQSRDVPSSLKCSSSSGYWVRISPDPTQGAARGDGGAVCCRAQHHPALSPCIPAPSTNLSNEGQAQVPSVQVDLLLQVIEPLLQLRLRGAEHNQRVQQWTWVLERRDVLSYAASKGTTCFSALLRL